MAAEARNSTSGGGIGVVLSLGTLFLDGCEALLTPVLLSHTPNRTDEAKTSGKKKKVNRFSGGTLPQYEISIIQSSASVVQRVYGAQVRTTAHHVTALRASDDML